MIIYLIFSSCWNIWQHWLFKELKIQSSLNYLKSDSESVKPDDCSCSTHIYAGLPEKGNSKKCGRWMRGETAVEGRPSRQEWQVRSHLERGASFPGGSVVKNLPAVQETQERRVRSLDRDAPLEEGTATHSRILAWKVPMDRGAWRATVHGLV